MPDHSSGPIDSEITTEEELRQAFDSIVESAFENGLNVAGSYVSRNGSEHPDVEVVVYELAKP